MVVSPPLIKLQVYFLLTDPEDGGLNQTQIAKRLGKGKSTISEHVTELVSGDYVKKTGDKSPGRYQKGPEAEALDRFCFEQGVRGQVRSSGWGATQSSEIPPQSSEEIKPVYSHLPGNIKFIVEREGSLSELIIKDPDKAPYKVALFGQDIWARKKKANGSRCYHADLWINGEWAHLQYTSGKDGKGSLLVSGLEVKHYSEHLPKDGETEGMLAAKACTYTKYLAIYGGWRFGAPERTNEIPPHRVIRDRGVVGEIEDNIRELTDGKDWKDHSKDVPEVETCDPVEAENIRDFTSTRKVVRDQARISVEMRNQIFEIRATQSETLTLLRDFAQTQKADTEALVTQVTKDEVEKKVDRQKAKGATASIDPLPEPDKWSVMYG